jgi:ABC-2 type transport system ATP-binding protein
MTASNGLFEMQVETDKEKLLTLLDEHKNIGKVKEDNELIIANLNQKMNASEINAYLFENGITLSHLVKRMPSLEQQFLDLTNNQTV